MSRWRIIVGDLRGDVLNEFGDGYFHGVFCDPPYGFSPDGRARTWDDLEAGKGKGFMGTAWDAAVPGASFWRTVLRVVRPGAHVLAFGGTRTYHRLASAIEDAGFEVRDMLSWLYSSGFPKSLNVSKAIDAAAGVEREVVGQKYVTNITRKNGLGAGNFVGGVIQSGVVDVTAPATAEAVRWSGYGTALKPAHEPIVLARKAPDATLAETCRVHGCGALAIDDSRVPYADDADRAALTAMVDAIRAKGGVRNESWANHSDLSGANPAHENGRWPANVLFDEKAATELDQVEARASRFFYVAKANRRERDAGCETLNRKTPGECTNRVDGSDGLNSPRAGAGRTSGAQNDHPTVKPIKLATYLARLILPPKGPHPRRILVPFSGSGSEMIGAILAGWDEVVGVESSDHYAEIAKHRLRHHLAVGQASLFDETNDE